MERNREIFLLEGLVIVLLVAGYTVPSFPYAIMIAIAPLFRVYSLIKKQGSFLNYIPYIVVPLLISYVFISALSVNAGDVLHHVIFGIIVSCSFFLFWLTDKYSPNRLGFITVILYWLAMEYAAVLLLPGLSGLLLGTALIGLNTAQNLSAAIGVMGISAWILFANVLLYYALFRERGILHGFFRPLTMIYSLILIVIPAIISWQFYPGEFSPEDYQNSNYVFGRTAAWVSVLIVLYSLVQRKVKKP